MENASIAGREKKISLKASKIFEVQRRTLQNLANKSSLLPKRAAAVNLRLKTVPEEEVVKYMLLLLSEATFRGLTLERRDMGNFYVIFKEWTATSVRFPSEIRTILTLCFSTTPIVSPFLSADVSQQGNCGEILRNLGGSI